MGEARRKARSLADRLAADPWCIYCGDPATTMEHMPPRVMFLKFRPDDMVFPCCQACNFATRRADQVAGFVASIRMQDQEGSDHHARFRKHFQALLNNERDLLFEMRLPRAQMRRTAREAGLPAGSGALRADGPILSRHMETFAAKFGFAVHYHQTGRRVGPDGAVLARWFSNQSMRLGHLPTELVSRFKGPETLRQGKQEASDEFLYRWLTDGTVTGVVGAFGDELAVLAIASSDRGRIEDIAGGFPVTATPGCFK